MLALSLLVLLPAAASAHLLIGRFESPLPLVVYLLAAATAVALSFAVVIGRSPGGGAAVPAPDEPAPEPIRVPRVLRRGIQTVGLIGWLWVVIQGVLGATSSDADVGSLFLWTYGWVLLPILSAFVAPVWDWLDPFATLHDLGAAALRRLGVQAWRTAPYPAGLDRWPAVVAFVLFVWLELVYANARAGRTLTIVLLLYTAWTLAMMAQYGRDTWRRRGETFTVWFGLLNRLAPLTDDDDPKAATLRRRPFGAGLLDAHWTTAELTVVAAATGSILFDGLSQTQFWFDIFGTPPLPAATVQLLLFLGVIVGAVLLVGRLVGTRAMSAGLVPIALGYLIAHYLTAIAFDGQRILAALSDPFQLGWNLLGFAGFEPNETWLPYGVVWAIELVAVVGGHMLGAVMGHRAAMLDRPAGRAAAASKKAAGSKKATGPVPQSATGIRVREVPLAVLMVALTTLTLWSLGQNLVRTQPAPTAGATAPVEALRPPGVRGGG